MKRPPSPEGVKDLKRERQKTSLSFAMSLRCNSFSSIVTEFLILQSFAMSLRCKKKPVRLADSHTPKMPFFADPLSQHLCLN
jgi:hypothetical protein